MLRTSDELNWIGVVVVVDGGLTEPQKLRLFLENFIQLFLFTFHYLRTHPVERKAR
jgi:hypothetical protein